MTADKNELLQRLRIDGQILARLDDGSQRREVQVERAARMAVTDGLRES